MADDIRTMKSYMTGLTMYAGQEICTQLMIHLQLFQLMIITTQSYLQDFRLAGISKPKHRRMDLRSISYDGRRKPMVM